eukprot:s3085_g9.t2
MASDLIDWISRQAQIGGDARQGLVRAARRNRWEMQMFAVRNLEQEVSDIESVVHGLPYAPARSADVYRRDGALPHFHVAATAGAGGIALPLAVGIVHPLDTVRTTMQAAASCGSFSHSLQSLGWRGLSRGFLLSLAWACPQGAIRMASYEACKETLLDQFYFRPFGIAVSAIAADFASSVVKVPRELITQRMQTGQYKSSWKAVHSIFREDGFTGFFRGYASTASRDAPFMLLLFLSYEQFKSWKIRLTFSQQGPAEIFAPWSDAETVLWGGISGTLAAWLTTPFDVIKTRIMTSNTSLSFQEAVKGTNGLAGLFRGAAPRSAWWFCVSSVFFASYERLRAVLQQHVDSAVDTGGQKSFAAEIICGEPQLNADMIENCSPNEIAVLSRAWRLDFGVPSPRRLARRSENREHLQERQHYVGGREHMYMLDGYVAAVDEEFENRRHNVTPPYGQRPAPREAWPDDHRYHRQEQRPVVVRSDRSEKGAPNSPYGRQGYGGGEVPRSAEKAMPDEGARRNAAVLETSPGASPQQEQLPRKELRFKTAKQDEIITSPIEFWEASSASAISVALDGSAVFVVDSGGLRRFDLPDLRLTASAAYTGDAAGYADVAAGMDFVVCADVDGNLFRHDAVTCELQLQRTYQPSVVEHSKRLVASHLDRLSNAVTGLEGGFGGASRLAVGADAVYLGGRDGVVTAYVPGSLTLRARCRLLELPRVLPGPSCAIIGVRALCLSPYKRLYCAVQSSVHVLTSPGMTQVALLRGGPRVPVFGSVSAVAESRSGDYVFVADVGGPSIHVWGTRSFRWIARVELQPGAERGRICSEVESSCSSFSHSYLGHRAQTSTSSTMKFAKTLQEKLREEWQQQYVDYKMLKKVLKLEQETAVRAFCDLLESELTKVHAFMQRQQDDIWKVVCDGVDIIPTNARQNALVSVNMAETMVDSIQNFKSYVELNRTAVRKIIKKFDKRFHEMHDALPLPPELPVITLEHAMCDRFELPPIPRQLPAKCALDDEEEEMEADENQRWEYSTGTYYEHNFYQGADFAVVPDCKAVATILSSPSTMQFEAGIAFLGIELLNQAGGLAEATAALSGKLGIPLIVCLVDGVIGCSRERGKSSWLGRIMAHLRRWIWGSLPPRPIELEKENALSLALFQHCGALPMVIGGADKDLGFEELGDVTAAVILADSLEASEAAASRICSVFPDATTVGTVAAPLSESPSLCAAGTERGWPAGPCGSVKLWGSGALALLLRGPRLQAVCCHGMRSLGPWLEISRQRTENVIEIWLSWPCHGFTTVLSWSCLDRGCVASEERLDDAPAWAKLREAYLSETRSSLSNPATLHFETSRCKWMCAVCRLCAVKQVIRECTLEEQLLSRSHVLTVSIRNPGCVCQIRPARRVEASQAVEIVGATIRVGAKMQMMVRCSARIDTILRAEVQGPRFSLCAATEERLLPQRLALESACSAESPRPGGPGASSGCLLFSDRARQALFGENRVRGDAAAAQGLKVEVAGCLGRGQVLATGAGVAAQRLSAVYALLTPGT